MCEIPVKVTLHDDDGNELFGSTTNGSIPAPAIVFVFRASYKASSSTIPPRAVLTTYAVFRMLESSELFIMPLVSGVLGQFIDKKSMSGNIVFHSSMGIAPAVTIASCTT